MNVSHIRIRNVLGIQELDIEPGGVTVLEGDNGSGKTSTLEAVRAVLSGGHDATLLRHGAEEGEVVLVLDDGTELWKRITATKSTLKVTDPQGRPVRAPQTWLKDLVDRLSINPIEFLHAKDRAAILAEAVPMPVTTERKQQLLDAAGGITDMPTYHESSNVLDAIEELRKAVYDERTGHNRLAKRAETNALRLAETLPEQIADGDVGELQRLRAELNKTVFERNTARFKATTRVSQDTARWKTEAEAEKVAIQDRVRTAIESLRVNQRDETGRIDRSLSAKVAKATGDMNAAVTETDVATNATIVDLEKRITGAEQNAETAKFHRRSAALLTEAESETAYAKSHAVACTAAIERLDDIKSDVLTEFPIFGLSVQDGKVYHFDIPFERLNNSAQIQIAVEVARLRAGDIPLICVDGLESLDPATFDLFVTAMMEAELQAIVTRVTSDKGLVVKTLGVDL